MTDVWQAASAASTQGKVGSKDYPPNATPAATPIDSSNPFATQTEGSDAIGGGGTWDPRVPLDVIEGRMVIMVPTSFRDDAPDPFNDGKVREEYRVDLHILDGDPFTFEYNFKASKDAEKEVRTWEVTDFPSRHRGQTIAQGGLIRALKGAEKSGKFLYGVLTRVPQRRDLGTYPTPEKLAEALAQYREDFIAGKRGITEPRSTWGLDERPHVLTPARVSLAAAWWEIEKVRRLNAGE